MIRSQEDVFVPPLCDGVRMHLTPRLQVFCDLAKFRDLLLHLQRQRSRCFSQMMFDMVEDQNLLCLLKRPDQRLHMLGDSEAVPAVGTHSPESGRTTGGGRGGR